MDRSALDDIQQALNTIRSELERTDDETKFAALELMLSTSASVVALAKKLSKPKTKTVTRTVAIPKTKIIRQKLQQPKQKADAKDSDQKDLSAIKPQPPLPNQRIESD